MRSFRSTAALALIAVLALAGCTTEADGSTGETTAAEQAPESSTRTITDMDGRTVEVPATIDTVATIGSVPVINGFLFAVGAGDKIVSGLPDWAADNPQWKYQYEFAPQMRDQETVEGPDGPLAEDLVALNPDVILTMSTDQAEPLEQLGLTVVVLQWYDDTDVKNVITLLGDLFGEPERAQAYTEYFDDAISRLSDLVADEAASDPRTAIYMNPEQMSRPHLIAEWWISQGGGHSVTSEFTEPRFSFNTEQLITWDPDVIFVSSPAGVDQMLADSTLAPLTAVANEEIYPVPIGAHLWGNRTSEQPLTAFWAASMLYPDSVSYEDLLAEVEYFYTIIYDSDLTDDQLNEIASGER
ncbi:MAG: ABC transporter substrate-binding protein [Beutenbergiaceae bacterium]